MAVLELTLVPVGMNGTSVSPYVAKAFETAKSVEGIQVALNPMGTVLEGDIDLLFEAVRKMQEAVFSSGVHRVYSVIKIDDRRDKKASLDQKIKSVMDKVE